MAPSLEMVWFFVVSIILSIPQGPRVVLSMSATAARILVDISRSQDEEVGDGTTSVTIFAAELLNTAK